MSEIKVNSIKGVGASAAAITVNNTDGTCTANITNNLSNRNKVINGAMICSQRASSASVTGSTNAYVALDRFKSRNVHDGAYTLSQSTTSPDGFANSLKVDVTTADTSLASNVRATIEHFIEAQDLQDLGYGTSSAKTITVSFYVRSNKTGNYGFSIEQADNSYKQVTLQYTINSADTWERKTFTIAGDTSGVINNDNGSGLELYWWLAAGSTYTSGSTRTTYTAYANGDFGAGQAVNLFDSTSNEWYITGVQLEVNSSGVATDFEHRSLAVEKSLCSRYCQVMTSNATNERINFANVVVHGAGNGVYIMVGLLPMRTAPSVTTTGSFSASVLTGSWTATAVSSITSEFTTNNGNDRGTWGYDGMLAATIADSCTTGLSGQIFSSSGYGQFVFSAEL